MASVVFVHPDLGIGGAERLVVDAALALKRKGHTVTLVTAHHDSNHCFPETVDSSLDVVCVGDWLPRSTFGKFYAFWAYMRMVYLAFYLTFFSGKQYNVLFVDQISASIPILRLRRGVKILFYCHFPDQLLTERRSVAKKAYRFFMDSIEERTTKMADVILVNSYFTAAVFKDTFKSISTEPGILHPSLDFSSFEGDVSSSREAFNTRGKKVFLSLNRFERKKNVGLAVEAFARLLNDVSSEERNDLLLIVAGGYDNRVTENVQHYAELETLAERLRISKNVRFLRSPSDDTKRWLLREATCLIYTPHNEHFGIVPLEAMYCGTPVLAVNSGGPVETVKEGETGFLRPQTAEDFAEVLKMFADGKVKKEALTKACKNHVKNKFSFDKFASQLHFVVQGLIDGRKIK